MQPTIQLIELQTYLLSKGESMIDKSGYKRVPEVMQIISKIWDSVDVDERGYIEKLLAGTEYPTPNQR